MKKKLCFAICLIVLLGVQGRFGPKLAIATKGTIAPTNAGVPSKKPQAVYVCRIANGLPNEQPRAIAMKWMAGELTKRSNGRIKAKYYGNGVLGKDTEIFQYTTVGSVQVFKGAGWEVLSGKLSLWSVPFMFNSYEELSYFNKSDFVKSIAKEASKNGIYIPGINFLGFRNIQTVKKVIKEPDDLKGLKMRTPGQPMIIEFYKACGAHPVSTSINEVYNALSTNTVDGACNMSSGNYGYKIHEVAQNFTWINYAAGPDPLMVSMNWYKSLPDDLQKLFDQVALESNDKCEQMTMKEETNFSQKIADASINVVKVIDDPALRSEWIQKTAHIKDKFIKEGLFTQADLDAAVKVLVKYRTKRK